MQTKSATEELEIRLFLEAIFAQYGYDFRGYSSASIQRRVLSALTRSGFKSLGELQHHILVDEACFASVLEVLTVRATEPFRDPAFYKAYRQYVVPVLRTYPLFKIWHAGCATGEEVYSHSILLTEEGLYERAQIYATDLSQRALDQAKQGTYSSNKLPVFTENHEKGGGTTNLSTFYTAAYDGFAMNESLRRNVHFFHHDLVSDHSFGEMQVLFCRNVCIYFGRDLRARVIRKLGQSLSPGGFLCLGSGERLTREESDAQFTEFAPEAQIYRFEG